MANFVGVSRSNYFTVKDDQRFRVLLNQLNLEYQVGGDGSYMVYPEDGDWPTEYYDVQDEEEKEFEVDVVHEIRPHLPPGEVCILHTIGNERLRYLNHAIVAFNCEGVILHNSQESFYDELNRLGHKFDKAE